jgi:hypothetical protein
VVILGHCPPINWCSGTGSNVSPHLVYDPIEQYRRDVDWRKAILSAPAPVKYDVKTAKSAGDHRATRSAHKRYL